VAVAVVIVVLTLVAVVGLVWWNRSRKRAAYEQLEEATKPTNSSSELKPKLGRVY